MITLNDEAIAWSRTAHPIASDLFRDALVKGYVAGALSRIEYPEAANVGPYVGLHPDRPPHTRAGSGGPWPSLSVAFAMGLARAAVSALVAAGQDANAAAKIVGAFAVSAAAGLTE
ncbi:MAG: hypothetical protein RQ833_07490 [Sphingomonadaceae bacterium]|nr:hypothetical protein [Sphingomonadaceae bacterium]